MKEESSPVIHLGERPSCVTVYMFCRQKIPGILTKDSQMNSDVENPLLETMGCGGGAIASKER